MEINTRILAQFVELSTIIEMVKSKGINKQKALTFLTEQIKVREEEIKLLQVLQKKTSENDIQ